jgi:type II secretory pathway component GspD/PulD (secretin)
MKNIIFTLLLITSSFNYAADAPISLQFKGVSLIEFAESTYKSLLGKDFVTSPDLAMLDKKITLNIKAISKAELPEFLKTVLAKSGINVTQSGDIIYLEKMPDATTQAPISPTASAPQITSEPLPLAKLATLPEKVEVYSPRHRTAFYLQNLLNQSGFDFPRSSDQKADLLILAGDESRVKLALDLLLLLDTPNPQVLVKALLYEVNNTNGNGSGFKLAFNLLDGKVGVGINQGATVPALSGSVSIKASNIEAIIGAFSSDSRFKLISTPVLRVQDGKNGRFIVGSQVPVLGAMQLDKNGNPVQSIEYRDSGVILDISPSIRQSSIDLQVQQTLSTFVETTVGVTTSPTLLKREINTALSIEDGGVVMMGGLNSESSTAGRSGLTWLPHFMNNLNESNEKKDLLLFLQVNKI